LKPHTFALLTVLSTVGATLLGSGCAPPPHAAVVKCSGTNFSKFDVKRDCDVRIERFDRQTAATLRVDTRRRSALVTGHFALDQGSARVVLHGTGGPQAEATISPDQPARLEATVRLRRPDNEFHLRFHPDGEASGLHALVSFEAR